jgi:hypothetical protein
LISPAVNVAVSSVLALFAAAAHAHKNLCTPIGPWMVDDGLNRRLERSVTVSNRAHGNRVATRVAAGLAAASIALATAGSALAQPPGDSCSPAAMMSGQADEMNQLADYLRNHPDTDNAGNPADAADALQMVAALRNIQAGMAAKCGLTMDQATNPGSAPGH